MIGQTPDHVRSVRRLAVGLALLTGCAGAVPTVGISRQALSKPARKGSVYRVDPIVSALTIAGTLGVNFGLVVDRRRWDRLSACEGERRKPTRAEISAFEALGEDEGVCDNTRVDASERFVTRNSSSRAHFVSDLLVSGLAALPFAVSAADLLSTANNQEPGLSWGEDALVISETYGLTMLATYVLKFITQRTRPLAYNPAFSKAERHSPEARLSFPSGHSAHAFAAASVMTMTLVKRHDSSASAVAFGGIGYATALLVAYLRVEAGKHFVTDVLAGAVLGTAIGLLVPHLHARPTLSESPATTTTGAALQSTPVLGFTGAW